jgi:phosphoglycerate dehydrogenase-like enzyme
MKPVICVTEQEYKKAEDIFSAQGDWRFIPVAAAEDAVCQAVKENEAFGVILGVDKYEDELYKSLSAGGIIARFGVGHDGVDKEKACENGLVVTNTPGVLDDSVAEHALWLMGALARNVSRHDADMKKGAWEPAIGMELRGKTLLVLGCGSIGRKAARIASFGFSMNVIAYDVAELDAAQMKADFGISEVVTDLDDGISRADFITMHLPSLPATRHFVNAEFIAKMKASAFLVNTARGPIVDENALYDALKDGTIGGAALDVFEAEPYEARDGAKVLSSLANIVLTPHVGSSTVEACERMARSCIKNVIAARDKKYESCDILNEQVITKLS